MQVPQEDLDDVLVIDGYERTVMTVNGMVPGPTIEVYEGTEVSRRPRSM
jgi:FtsP/CotA-like multicopper oxidase with cupredoxin domain